MNNFKEYITPEQAKEKGDKRPLAELKKLAKMKPSKCLSCEMEDEWKYAGCGLCFSCTTGEADASGDYELTN